MGQSENEKKRLSHYVPAELVDRFNKRADERVPALQRQVYFEEIIQLGLVAEKILPDLVKATNQAYNVLGNRDEKNSIIWEKLARAAYESLQKVIDQDEDSGVKHYE